MSRKYSLSLILIVMCLWSSTVSADATLDQAVWLIRKSTLVHRDGLHNILLRALRQMREPTLEPLFSNLSQSKHPTMKIHGILGLAEISPNERLDLALLANVKQPAIQAQLVSAAIDAKLINTEDAKQLITWPGLDPAVKVIVAAMLMDQGEKFDIKLLDKPLASDIVALKGMAAVLKLQLGDADAMKILQKINQSDEITRDNARILILQTAMRYKFDKIGPWAMAIAQEKEISRTLRYIALRAAVMFKTPDAVNLLMQWFDEVSNPEDEIKYNPADCIRLSMLALAFADQLDARIFAPMLEDDQKVVKQIARTGMAIASKKSATTDILALIKSHNILTSRWIMQEAKKMDQVKARVIYIALVKSSYDSPKYFKAQSLELAVLAAQKLFESGPDASILLRDLLVKAPPLTQEAILMSLIRTRQPNAHKVIAGIDDWSSQIAGSMALLLRAKNLKTLDDKQLKQLALIVQGGAGLQDPLRVQAAWVYLKMTHQDRVALATLLGEDR